jgi:hypothetical protein
MQTVRTEDGREYLLLKRSQESSLVRDPATGEQRHLPNEAVEPVGASPLETAAQSVPAPARRVLTAVHSERALGLLLELDRRGPVAVRDLLGSYDCCESDLHGLLGEFRAAGLVEEAPVGGQAGYAATDRASEGLARLREERIEDIRPGDVTMDGTDERGTERGYPGVVAERFDTNPLVTPADDDRIGENLNGPSVVRAPPWDGDPLGDYYIYFAHHGGEFVRLAYADDPRGPWTVHTPGTLPLAETQFDSHIASPDVHLDHDDERVRMYFHGCCGEYGVDGETMPQVTDVALSPDGLDFETRDAVLGNSYFRVFEHGGAHYALANDGRIYRGEDPLGPFERGPVLFEHNRHFAVQRLDDAIVRVYLTRRGDRPERVLATTLDLTPSWREWEPTPKPPETVLWPERDYEGGDAPMHTSEGGSVHGHVRALRDPCVFVDGDRTYLYYAVAGEEGIAGAELHER